MIHKHKNNNKKGMTLIEVTLVIAVLLGLISVLFIGVSAYKSGSDRAKCILNVSTVQKAVRSYQNLYELDEGDALAQSAIVGAGKMLEVAPECPTSGNAYTWATAVPTTGTQYLLCDDATGSDHQPASTSGW